ncbi:hypothetical protein DCO58_08560 [Helicobacter saguini]|uniref:Uncharacterized protein n=1 Tax=Helicobacter saguini TaxID=1548018 RepID=A0A347VNV4_9HELI|nr:hypothetical protein [Helicobacter saguini]MWV61625.1 hypothetical protein [Helicobacter saguini]MWV67703.1 hypothetical protein [Helicobacter saguini]MWV70055.1 hypothetical protein [Helicobacter saguini]MWV72732.1 hypothetical protein [Helicobacter saguini]TLD92007.1 hypothetical protein LS64_010875 [Helicobacter saguini]
MLNNEMLEYFKMQVKGHIKVYFGSLDLNKNESKFLKKHIDKMLDSINLSFEIMQKEADLFSDKLSGVSDNELLESSLEKLDSINDYLLDNVDFTQDSESIKNDLDSIDFDNVDFVGFIARYRMDSNDSKDSKLDKFKAWNEINNILKGKKQGGRNDF